MNKFVEEDARKILLNQNIIFLDKDCDKEHIRHSFYIQKINNDEIYLYHVRVSSKENENLGIKDFDTVKTDSTALNNALDALLSTINGYITSDGYTISYNKN